MRCPRSISAFLVIALLSIGRAGIAAPPAPAAAEEPEPPPAPLSQGPQPTTPPMPQPIPQIEEPEPPPAPLQVRPDDQAATVPRDTDGQDSAALAQIFRAHVDQAASHYTAGRWDAAVTEYRAAYAIRSRPVLLFNIAQSHRKAGRWQDALVFYERFMVEDPANQLVLEAEAHVTAVRALIEREEQIKKREAAERTAAEQTDVAKRLAAQNVKLERGQAEALQTVQRLKKQPIYKRGWFWGVLAASTAAVGAGIALGVVFTPRDPSPAGGIFDVSLAITR